MEAIATIKATISTGYLLSRELKNVPQNSTYLPPPRQPVQKSSPFQYETATGTLSKNLPFHPTRFATLEIGRTKTPAITSRAFSFAGHRTK
jgi:hypothetical protein